MTQDFIAVHCIVSNDQTFKLWTNARQQMVLFYFRLEKLFTVIILLTIQAIEHLNGINMLSLALIMKILFRSKMSFCIIPIQTILPSRLLHPLQEFLFQTNTTELRFIGFLHIIFYSRQGHIYLQVGLSFSTLSSSS